MMTRAPRLPLIDALRGLAVAQMIVYHFIYDLKYFGWVQLAMTRDQPWVGWRTAIVTQFLLLVGVSLVLRAARRPGAREFWRRRAQVAAAAALVSAGSWLLFGPRFIWFGILHFIAVALLLGRLALPLGAWNLALGAALVVAGVTFSSPLFDAPPWQAIGLMTFKPRTEDYVPLLPWMGVVLLGIGAASLWQRRGFALLPALAAINAAPPRLLTLLGTWALTVYLLHQPLIMGALWAVKRLLTGG
jgi:uncharacterized membrane protein